MISGCLGLEAKWGDRRVTTNYGAFRGNNNILKLDVVMVAPPCECTKKVELNTKYMNCVICELYLSKSVK